MAGICPRTSDARINSIWGRLETGKAILNKKKLKNKKK
jgi:hypothetical protein